MANLGSLSVFLNANTGPFQRGMMRATNVVRGFARTVTVASAIAVAGITAIGVSSVKAAADAAETEQKFNVVFRDIAKSANIAADEIAQSFDVADSAAREMLGTTGDLLTGFGFGQEQALKMAKQIATLAGDLASFQNIAGGAEEANERLTKGILGQTRNLQMLGIVARQDTKEFKDMVKAMQENHGMTLLQAKAQVILNTAIEQSKNAIGDYARTQDSLVNTTRAIFQQIRNLRELFGKFLITVLGLEDIGVKVKTILQGMTLAFKNDFNDWALTVGKVFARIKAAFLSLDKLGIWLRDNFANVFTAIAISMRRVLIGAILEVGIRLGALIERFIGKTAEARKKAQEVLERPFGDIAITQQIGKAFKEAQGVIGRRGVEELKAILQQIDNLTEQEIKALEARILNIKFQDAARGAGIPQGPPPSTEPIKFAKAIRAGTAAAFALRTGRDPGAAAQRDQKKNLQANLSAASSLETILNSGIPISNLKVVDRIV